MGKKYHCDFCNKSFQDSRLARLRHFRGVHHQRLRQQHYDSFKDPSDLAAGGDIRPACMMFSRTGRCSYGTTCRYSHRLPASRLQVNTMCFQTALDAVQVMQQAQVDADQWMAAWHQRQKDPKGKHLRTSRTKSARGEGSASQPQAESLLTPLQPVTSQILPAPLVSSTQQMSVCNSGWGWTPQDQA